MTAVEPANGHSPPGHHARGLKWARRGRIITMTRRRLVLFALPVALMLLGVVGWVLWYPPPGITLENAERIHQGMTLAEVEALLGGPAGDYRTPGATKFAFAYHFLSDPDGEVMEWNGDEGTAMVSFDADSRVFNHMYLKAPSESLLAKLRRWLRL